jgi:membrane-associated protease RseP (regulator of RpoE activity)
MRSDHQTNPEETMSNDELTKPDEPVTDDASVEERASDQDRRRTEQQRLRWAAAVIAALALFAGGYAIGQASAEDTSTAPTPSAIDDMELPPFLRDLDGEFRFDGSGIFDRFQRDLVCDIVEEEGTTLTLVCDGPPAIGTDRPGEVPGESDDGRTDEPGFLGVSIIEAPRGVVVAEVVDDSPALEAGLQVDDVIVGFDGSPVDSAEQLSDRIAAAGAGAEVSITVRRFEAEITVQVTLSERPD